MSAGFHWIQKWDEHHKHAKELYEGARKEALTRGAGLVLAKSNQTVPFNEGILAASGHIDVDAEEGVAVISYDTPYAVRLHENPQYNFQHGRRGKWLEKTLEEIGEDVARLMAVVMKKRLP